MRTCFGDSHLDDRRCLGVNPIAVQWLFIGNVHIRQIQQLGGHPFLAVFKGVAHHGVYGLPPVAMAQLDHALCGALMTGSGCLEVTHAVLRHPHVCQNQAQHILTDHALLNDLQWWNSQTFFDDFIANAGAARCNTANVWPMDAAQHKAHQSFREEDRGQQRNIWQVGAAGIRIIQDDSITFAPSRQRKCLQCKTPRETGCPQMNGDVHALGDNTRLGIEQHTRQIRREAQQWRKRGAHDDALHFVADGVKPAFDDFKSHRIRRQ